MFISESNVECYHKYGRIFTLELANAKYTRWSSYLGMRVYLSLPQT